MQWGGLPSRDSLITARKVAFSKHIMRQGKIMVSILNSTKCKFFAGLPAYAILVMFVLSSYLLVHFKHQQRQHAAETPSHHHIHR